MSEFITNGELRIEAERLCDENERLREENNKLRDAMYTKAGKHALHHMDEDELRIWATQQAEHIEELKELMREIWKSCPVSEEDCAKCSHRIEESDDVWCDIPILMEQLGVLAGEGESTARRM